MTISRVAADRYASDATLLVDITNNADVDRPAVYSEVWPWWVKGWMSEMAVSVNGTARRESDLAVAQLTPADLLQDVEYHPSVPPTPSTTTLHLSLTLPARSTLRLSIPFTKLTLKYDDHRPDAERGREIPPGVLTLLDVEGEDAQSEAQETVDPRKSSRRRVYSAKLLLDVPTPDFSMPYNVIIMSSTVMAVFFGSIQGRLVRRWGWVETDGEGTSGSENSRNGEPRVEPSGLKESAVYDVKAYEQADEEVDTDSDAESEPGAPAADYRKSS